MIPKFRAWRTATKTMHKVASLAFDDVGFIMKSAIVIEGEYNLCPVSNSEIILMQSTGLFDRDGTEIFIDDIVMHYVYNSAPQVAVVSRKSSGTLIMKYSDDECDVLFANKGNTVVLGDRFQHPHLLVKTA